MVSDGGIGLRGGAAVVATFFTLAAAWGLGAPATQPGGGDEVTIDFVVRVPEGTKADSKVWVAGNATELKEWNAAGLELKRGDDGRYRGSLRVRRGTNLEYKLTRGTWETVEKSGRGGDIANRTLAAKEDATVEVTVEAWSEATKSGASTSRSGDIRLHEKFHSKVLGNDRTVIVYVPPGYEKAAGARYPVLYMHDGQNVFDAGTSFMGVEWGADEAAQRLIGTGRIEPIIIVGIYNTPDRMNEYTPWPDANRNGGGKGEDYERFVIEEVKPFIDGTYRTQPDRKHTAVAGSSLGGLISLDMCLRHRDVFSMAGVMSPALSWAEKRVIRDAKANCTALRSCRIWLDMGSREGVSLGYFSAGISWTRELVTVFDACGMAPGRDYYYFEDVGAVHNEGAWAQRVDKMLLYFFAK